MKKLFIGILLSVVLCACQTLGLTPPKGFDQQLANAYGVHTAVVQTATQAHQAGSLSDDQTKQAYQLAKDSLSVLDLAKSAEDAGDAAGAQRNLALALAALNGLQAFLTSKGVK